MKKLTAIFLLSCLIWACTRNTLPTISRRTTEPPSPTPLVEKDLVADAARGKNIFENRCDRCHGLYDPKEFNAARWDTILSIMTPRARLSKQETAHVTAYIKANSAK